MKGADPRVAAVFDRADGSGRPWFSPWRRRVVNFAERQRLVDYLNRAPLAVRAAGLEVDPLQPDRGAVVPVGYRTDGVWVWQEASAYYLHTYGTAPEDALLEHIEQRKYAPPTDLSDHVLNAAADAAMVPSESQTTDSSPQWSYFAEVDNKHPVHDPHALLRQYTDAQGHRQDEALVGELEWRPTWRFRDHATKGGDYDLVSVTEHQASAAIDRRWRRWTGRSS